MTNPNLYPTRRMTLTNEENQDLAEAQQLEDAWRRDTAFRFLENGTVQPQQGDIMFAPVVGAHITIAENRARNNLRNQPVFPEDREEIARFANVDPAGKFSEIDLSLAQRLERVQAAALLCSPQIQEYVTRVQGEMRPGGAFAGIAERMRSEAEIMRVKTRAAKLCQNDAARNLLMQQAEQRKQALPVQEYTGIVECLEMATGLRTEYTQNYARLMAKRQDPMDPTNLDSLDMNGIQPGARTQLPSVALMRFPDHDNIERQQFWAHPANWEKTTREEPDADRVIAGLIRLDQNRDDALRTRYCAAAAKQTMEVMFQGLPQNIDPMRLVYIKGQSLAHMVAEQPDFNNLTPVQRQMRGYSLLGMAVMNRQKVEAYPTVGKGFISKKPMQINHAGFLPSPVRKVQLNAWERFFNTHFGLYREKAAAQAEYNAIMQGRREAAALVLAANTEKIDQAVETKYQEIKQMRAQRLQKDAALHAELFPHNEDRALHFIQGPDVKFSFNRTAGVSIVQAMLLARGHSMDDVFTVGRITESKKEAANLLQDYVRRHNTKALTEELFDGLNAASRVNRPAGNYYSSPKFTSVYDNYHCFSSMNFDLHQEVERLKSYVMSPAVSQEYHAMEQLQKQRKKAGIELTDAENQRIAHAKTTYNTENSRTVSDKVGEVFARVLENRNREQNNLPPVQDWDAFKAEKTAEEWQEWKEAGIRNFENASKYVNRVSINAGMSVETDVISTDAEHCPPEMKDFVKTMLVVDQLFQETHGARLDAERGDIAFAEAAQIASLGALTVAESASQEEINHNGNIFGDEAVQKALLGQVTQVVQERNMKIVPVEAPQHQAERQL